MNGDRSGSTLSITAAGAVTAVGYDLHTACASARAGLTRCSTFADYLIDSGDGEPGGQGVTVHAASVIADGFEGDMRALRIATAVLEQLPLLPEDMDSARLYVAIRLSGSSDDDAVYRLVERAIADAGWTQAPRLSYVSTYGHIAVADCLVKITSELGSGEKAILLCVDSLLSESRLGALESVGRLKTDDVAAGLQPGEAGLSFLLEKNPAGPTLGQVIGVGKLREPVAPDSDDVATGHAIDQLLMAAEQRIGGDLAGQSWVISDQNGEADRAFDWGSALSRMTERQSVYANPHTWYPAMQFGDTGSAAGGVGIATALGAFSRRYQPSPVAVVLLCENNDRAAILIKAGNQPHGS